MLPTRCLLRPLPQALLVALASPYTGLVAAQPKDDAIPTIVVVGNAQQQARIGGAASVVKADDIQNARAFNINEVLRRVPGVFAREEEGFGLRPNIGIRGLNPTRSTKVLLLEDGLPLAYSPYGDNASYYHPTIERFSSLEVLKGSAQIGFGPHTVGGVVNYLTPNPTPELSAKLRAATGTDGYAQVYGEVGNTFGADGAETGVLLQFVHKQAEGARAHMDFEVQDYNLKVVQQLGAQQALTFKVSHYQEDSDVPYSGLTAAEYAANPRANPFVNDKFQAERTGLSLVHHWALAELVQLDTALYHSEFHRDWWRQSSNSAQRPSDSSDPACASMTNLLTNCGTEGRLRDYEVFGFEPRLAVGHRLGEFKLGLRYQEEEQDRLQINTDTATGRKPGTSINGGVRENNERDVEVLSWFIENSFTFGAVTVTPGVRHEDIDYSRSNNLNNAAGSSNVTETLAGLGATLQLVSGAVLFAGIHEGFSPPRVEDVISNSNGTSIDLDSEQSLNSEIGIRYANDRNLSVEAALFRMDFANQIVPASIAGGTGATLTSAGETLHGGAELMASWELDRDFSANVFNPFVNLSWTWVNDAEYTGVRTSSVTPGVSVHGNRLPYTPEHTLALTAGVALHKGLRAQVELVHVAEMYSDDLNSRAVAANGQRGLIPQYTVYNLSVNYRAPASAWTVFLAGKNLTDKLFVVDMSRGLIPGMQRTWQAGVEWQF